MMEIILQVKNRVTATAPIVVIATTPYL